jgi:hypothetical protein
MQQRELVSAQTRYESDRKKLYGQERHINSPCLLLSLSVLNTNTAFSASNQRSSVLLLSYHHYEANGLLPQEVRCPIQVASHLPTVVCFAAQAFDSDLKG